MFNARRFIPSIGVKLSGIGAVGKDMRCQSLLHGDSPRGRRKTSADHQQATCIEHRAAWSVRVGAWMCYGSQTAPGLHKSITVPSRIGRQGAAHDALKAMTAMNIYSATRALQIARHPSASSASTLKASPRTPIQQTDNENPTKRCKNK